MSYDTRRLKTFKWLEDISKGYYLDILVYSGSLYATDSTIMVKVDYPEFSHLSDWEWSKVSRYCGDDGYLLETPELESNDHQYTDNRFFDDMFITQNHRCECVFDCKLIKKALKGFEINYINPNIAFECNRIEFTGHNADVSMRVLVMGMGEKK